jgi:predicted CoA-substrate-specific enzyme activase
LALTVAEEGRKNEWIDKVGQIDKTSMHRGKRRRVEALQTTRRLFIGIDIGSTSSDVVVLGEDMQVLSSDYRRTFGRPIETLKAQMEDLFRQFNRSQVEQVAVTGSAGRPLAKWLGLAFVNEVPAQAAAICHLLPALTEATIIDMGGQDSKLIFISTNNGRVRVRDFALNTVCAAGTGSFLDQQAQRLGVQIEDQFGKLALESRNVPRMAGRCSVFAKSDMIHLQQQATPMCDIIAGLCLALARNLKGNLGCGRKFVKPIVFTGGVAANTGVVRSIEQAFELATGELIVPDMHFFTGAIGAVLVAGERGDAGTSAVVNVSRLEEYLASRGLAMDMAPRLDALSKTTVPAPQSRVYKEVLSRAPAPLNAYLGVDVGSISTNVAVIDQQKRILSKAYLMTAGKPLEAVRQGLDMVGREVAGKVKILGAASTGSGRYLTGDFIGADVVINEITAQAAGALIVNPQVDTIFEIGGQDSKYISLENGVVVDFEMNHACAAGTGSFLEEQAQRLGININEEFAKLALTSEAPIKLGERCTVFMESDLLSYQQQGAKTKDLLAGLSYSIVANYLNRVVGRRRIGEKICFQGGTAYNKAVWSAFEKVVGKPVQVPDHHEVTGAIGAAAIAAERMQLALAELGQMPPSKFRGFENLASIEYKVESFTCEHCPNHCEIKKVQLESAEPLYYGSRCDRYNLKKEVNREKVFDAFEFRRQLLMKYAGQNEKTESAAKDVQRRCRIGIPIALTGWQLLPLFGRFFKSLGFEVVLSGATDRGIIRMGVECSTAEPCFPVKVAYGHIAALVEKRVDYIFLPSIVSMTSGLPEAARGQLCPYVQSLPYQANSAFAGKLGDTKILTAVLRMGEGQRLVRKTFCQLGRKLGVSAGAVEKALRDGLAAQEGFESALRTKGAEILARLGPEQRLFVLISRPYNGCDEGVNLRLPKKLADLGVQIIPMDMLDLGQAEVGDKWLHSQVYWTYGQKILRAAEIIKKDPRLFAIYLSNFSCGPDSFLSAFFKDIMANKPCLQLELDEHSADAGVITRLEAFLESLKHYRQEIKAKEQVVRSGRSRCSGKRKLYIPYMGDAAYGLAACFRAYGQPAQVMPIADEASLLRGRRFTSGKECLPCTITTGDMLKVLEKEGAESAAFFMPAASGPCRFGMYNCMHRLVLRYAGASDVPVIAPNQDDEFYRELGADFGGSVGDSFMKAAWTTMVGIDLLNKVILRLRPFAVDKESAQRVYEQCLKRWLEAAEKRIGLSGAAGLMGSIAQDFLKVSLNEGLRKPRIGVVGEIYVRSHPFANKNIIARLEELGAACDLASLAEWIYYTNFARGCKAWRAGRIGNLLGNTVRDVVQHGIEKKLARPLESRFGGLAELPIRHVLNLAGPYLDDSFEGEAILSVGKIVEYYHDGFGGVVNVMPFSCMPSTIVSGQTQRVSADCGGMPILNLSFDGQEDVTLTTRLEAFVEQVSSREGAKVGIGQVAAGVRG